LKIKTNKVPTWDGDDNSILEWLDKTNHLAYRNPRVYRELGLIAPLHLTDHVARWFHALPDLMQQEIQQNWGPFRLAISSHFMNQQWFDKMKGQILRMRYRQKGHKNEFPTNYFYRKQRAIKEVFTLMPSETIMEIMNGVPHYWKVLICDKTQDEPSRVTDRGHREWS